MCHSILTGLRELRERSIHLLVTVVISTTGFILGFENQGGFL